MKTTLQLKWIGMATCLMSGALAVGCESLDDTFDSNPYAGGKEPLGVKLSSEAPMPATGFPGDTILFKATGLLKYCNPAKNEYQFKFYLGEQDTKILNATDTTLTVKVPENCSSGQVYMVLNSEVFFGPNFTVNGNIKVDGNYGFAKEGTDDVVYTATPYGDNGFYLVGRFAKFGDYEHIGLGFVDLKGNAAASNTTNYGVKTGLLKTENIFVSQPYVKSISRFKDGRYLISGSFSNYECQDNKGLSSLNGQVMADNIILLNKNLTPDTAAVHFDELGTDRKGNPVTINVSRFNGAAQDPLVRTFITSDEKYVIAVGNTKQYYYYDYQPTFLASGQKSKPVSYVFRMNVAPINKDGSQDGKLTGDLDESYRPVATHAGPAGGAITEAAMDETDGVILVGTFTSFDGVPANGIVRLDKDGNVDRGFTRNLGSGIDGSVSTVSYNTKLKKMVITGSFTKVNGQARQNIAMLNADGTLDTKFVPRKMEGGQPNYAQLLDKDKVVISGTFSKYDGIPRQGFLLLDPDGTAVQDFNVPGKFEGQLYDVEETVTTENEYGLLLVGDIRFFNGARVNNVVLLQADFDHR